MSNREPDDRSAAVDALASLHDEVDALAGRIAARHGDRLVCRLGCAGCCRDGLTVFAVEAERIRRSHARLLEESPAHPPGACAFLDDRGGCRIYAERPYVCRTQGLPLRWHEPGPDDRTPVERRDICPENEAGPPITELPEDACWTIGPTESRLAAVARRFDPTDRRIPLRGLFASR